MRILLKSEHVVIYSKGFTQNASPKNYNCLSDSAFIDSSSSSSPDAANKPDQARRREGAVLMRSEGSPRQRHSEVVP